MYLTDPQLKSLSETLILKDLLAFKPLLDPLRYDKTAEIVWHSIAKPDKHYLYCQTDPDSKILAVAHTDVHGHITMPKMTYDRKLVLARQLDDRLGCWMITNYLRSVLPHDQPFDILLTTDEEIGASTAKYFTCPEGKQYNWMFEWDRRGTGVVMYDYETPELKALLECYNFKVEKGTFTDICYLSNLGCAGFNFGTAYYGEHSNDCYANMEQLFQQVDKFIPFYSEWYGKKLQHDHEAAYEANMRKINGWNWKDDKKKGDTKTGDDSGRKKTPVAGGLDIGHVNNHRSLPPVLPPSRSLVIESRIQHATCLTTEEIEDLDDDEYLMWAAFVNSHKHDDHKLKKAQALLKAMLKKRKYARNGSISNLTYSKWISDETEKYQNQVLNPGSEDLIDEDQVKFWEEAQRARELSHDLWEEYMSSDNSHKSFDEWLKSREIALAGGLIYDHDDRYFKKQAKEFDDRHKISSHQDDTDILNPSDEELLALEDDELASRIMEDPLYSSEQFPGGRESRSQHFDNLPNDLT